MGQDIEKTEVKPKGNLDKLRVIYDNLSDTEKEKVVRLGEGLLEIDKKSEN
jgi:hypothetical protein